MAVFDSFNVRAEDMIDPTYGRIRFSRYGWWPNDDEGNFSRTDEEIESHQSSMEELGLSGSDPNLHQFLPVNELQRP